MAAVVAAVVAVVVAAVVAVAAGFKFDLGVAIYCQSLDGFSRRESIQPLEPSQQDYSR